MNSVFLVTKVDFDNMENDHSHAIVRKKVGFEESKEKAYAWISKQEKHQYVGWDKVSYPLYTVEEISRLT